MSESADHHREQLRSMLLDPGALLDAWVQAYQGSMIRLPRPVDLEGLRNQLEPVARDLRNMASDDRQGRRSELRFRAGSQEVSELEKSVSFIAAQLGALGFSGFDLGALITALRDVLCQGVRGELASELGQYMEWLLVLANDSLVTARERAAYERWNQELDSALPLLMITPELPAAIFVCRPDANCLAGHFGRLLLAVVRVGARAIIIDVQGMTQPFEGDFAEALELFVSHRKIASKTTIIACGVPERDQDSWSAVCAAHDTPIRFEDSFEASVKVGLELGDWRLVPS